MFLIKIILDMKKLISAVFILSLFTSAQAATAPSALPAIKTVFVILEENANWDDITPAKMPYLWNTLIPMGGYAKEYYNPPGVHPSEPNYVWMEAGDHLGLITDDNPSAANSSRSASHLVTYLNNAGISWKAYQEDISGIDCPLVKVGKYAPKHNPFIFFQDVTSNNSPSSAYCIAHMRPTTELEKDLANNTVARYNFITPNLCNDMHDTCSTTVSREMTADNWLKNIVPKILNSQAYKNGGALIITWDEGEGKDTSGKRLDGPIGMVVLSPLAKANYSNSIHYTHSSLLRTLQEIFGVTPLLGDAAQASDLSDFFTLRS
jgi:hypothetical protein